LLPGGTRQSKAKQSDDDSRTHDTHSGLLYAAGFGFIRHGLSPENTLGSSNKYEPLLLDMLQIHGVINEIS
jgi:hypothetical protein